MPIVLACVAGYAVAAVACYRRWRAPGVIALAIVIAVADLGRGTWEWHRPHDDVLPFARQHDWACHSLGLLPVLAIFTPVALLALWLVRRVARDNARDDAPPSFWTQLGSVLVAFAVASAPALYALLHWAIMVWECDTL